MSTFSELAGLFVSGLLSATLLPGSSEALLLALLASGGSAGALWASATLGNTLGSCVNYALGRGLAGWAGKKRPAWLPSEHRQNQAEAWFNRYGVWTLLLAWLPVIGDAIPLVAGALKVRLTLFVLLVAVGKGARYAALIAFADLASAS